jgi:DNA-binding LytR/AlgR family response regulator
MLLALPYLFPHFFKEATWTTGKQVLHTIVVIVVVGFVNYLLSPLLVDTTYSWRDMFWFQGITLAIAILPVTVFTLWKQNSLLKKFEQQAVVLEKKLKEKLDAEKQKAPSALPQEKKIDFPAITLTGDYQGEKIVLQPEELYYITAANNYIKVYFVKNASLHGKDSDEKTPVKPSYSIIRMTMKKAEETLEAWPVLFRCHRAYIINLDKVEHVEGNAQGYKIQLVNTEELVPVSRNLHGEFSDKLLAIRDNPVLSAPGIDI